MGLSRGKKLAFAGVGVLPIAGLAAWFWWIPARIEAKVVEALEARLPVSADLGDVSLRWGGVSLAELRADFQRGGR